MKAYKHWRREYADDLEKRGRIRLMPLSYYRQEFERPGVQDKNENAVLATHRSPLYIDSTLRPQSQEMLERLGLPLGIASRVDIRNFQTRYTGPEFYVFCTTTIETPGLFEQDDAITTFPDIEEFGRALARAAGALFVDGYVANVRYNWRPQYVEDGPLRPPDPFLKHPDYAGQKEIRIAVLPRSRMEGPCFIESDLLIKVLG